MKNSTRRLAAVIATGALIAAGLTLSASAANAAAIPGTITLFGSGSAEGTVASKAITSGSATTNPMFYGISINGACPAGARDSSIIYVIQNGVKMGSLSTRVTPDLDGVYGTNGLSASDTSVHMDESTTIPGTNPYVDNKALDSITTPLANGAFEIRYYCFADFQNQDLVNDKYYSLTLNYNLAAHTWNAPVQLAATSTSLTAQADQATTKITLNATVKNASAAIATTATGNVTFNQTSPAAAAVGTVAVANGVATIVTGALAPGSYTFTATYAGDAAFNGSTSGNASASINGSNTAASTITVDIPAGIGSLTLSGVPAAVDLGTATLDGGLLKASKDLTGVTVTDTRQLDAPSWSLTGSVTDFTSGTKTLDGKYLGWTPQVVGGPATAGAAVIAAPTSTNGLKTTSTFATSPVVDGNSITTLKAGLNLAAPANTPAGHYAATLTLTLS